MTITHPWEFWTNLVVGLLAITVMVTAVLELEWWWQVGIIAIGDVPLIACCAVMVVVSVDCDEGVW